MSTNVVPLDRRLTVTYADTSSALYFTLADYAIADVSVDPEDRELWFDIYQSELLRMKTQIFETFGALPLRVQPAATAKEDTLDFEYLDALFESLQS